MLPLYYITVFLCAIIELTGRIFGIMKTKKTTPNLISACALSCLAQCALLFAVRFNAWLTESQRVSTLSTQRPRTAPHHSHPRLFLSHTGTQRPAPAPPPRLLPAAAALLGPSCRCCLLQIRQAPSSTRHRAAAPRRKTAAGRATTRRIGQRPRRREGEGGRRSTAGRRARPPHRRRATEERLLRPRARGEYGHAAVERPAVPPCRRRAALHHGGGCGVEDREKPCAACGAAV